MELLIGLGVGVVLLYFWLLGHWFARILTFLALTVPFIMLALTLQRSPNETAASELIAMIGAGVMAWLVASLPIYFWRAHLKHADPMLHSVLYPPSRIKIWLLSPPGS